MSAIRAPHQMPAETRRAIMTELAVLDTTIQKTHEWLKDITDGLGFHNQRSAFAALRAVLHTLRDRLPLANAAQLGAQLPILIRGVYYEGWDPMREPSRFRHKQEFFDLVSVQLKEHNELRNTPRITNIVLGVLSKHLSPGETDKVRSVLPEEIRELWPAGPQKLGTDENAPNP
jgi:uncharacterized protein (DUF2267 family)